MDRGNVALDEAKAEMEVHREYSERHYRKNWWLLTPVLVLTIGSPFLGLFLAGMPGVLAGLAVALVTSVGGFFAITVEDKTRGDHFHE
jgi:hypothetical protein